MALIDTSLIGDGLSKIKKDFSYGHQPSIIMWSNGSTAAEKGDEDEQGFFGGTAKALESLVTSGTPESFNSFKFDAMIAEEHEDTATVTKFPVSSGFLVSDHVIKQNRMLKLTAVAVNMQNSAIWSASVQGLSVVSGAIFNSPIIPIVGGIAGGVASAFETSDRMQSAYNLFNSFRVTGQKLYISTILGPYLNCVVVSVKSRQDKESSHMAALEILLEELQVIGEDTLADEAKKAMEEMYDYSEFAKMAQSIGLGVIGGATLPGLGIPGTSPTKQLSNLESKLSKLSSPVSSVKGRLF